MRIPTATALVLAAVALAPLAARAECAMATAFIAPSTKTVPRDPTLFAFIPYPSFVTAQVDVFSGDGKPLETLTETVYETDDLRVVQVNPKTLGFDRLQIVLKQRGKDGEHWNREVTATYRVDPDWQRPAEKTTLTSVKPETSYWSCSFTEATMATMDGPGEVFRLEWADDLEAWAKGDRRTAVLPRSVNDFFRWGDRTVAPDREAKLQLGHASCLGWLFDWKDDLAHAARISVVHTDGMVVPLTAEPWRLDRPEKNPVFR